MNSNNPDKGKLDRQLARLKSHLAGQSASVRSADPPKAPARYLRLAEAVGGELLQEYGGTFCLVRRSYPFAFDFGETSLSAPAEVSVPLSCFEGADVGGEVALQQTVFFDTETTGLGGAGAVAFLIGCGSLTADGFDIRQYLLPDYVDEAAMLEYVMAEFGDNTSVVSYNGRAFDVPLVRDRMIVNRVAREIPYRHHVDLLHAARRLFRRRLRDCSLTNIEREVFGFHREDDLPGYLVPAAYFDWLSSEDISQIPAVLEHNRWDILTLFFLLERVREIFRNEGADLDEVEDLYSLSRVYERRRQRDKVIGLYRRIDDCGGEATPDVLWFHSLAFKRQGEWAQAVELWQRLTDTDTAEAYRAHVELAKYYEHRVKDAANALVHARRAAETGRRPAGPARISCSGCVA